MTPRAKTTPEELQRQLEPLHPASFAWALRCCGGDHGEAEDVLQTAYLEILEGRARYSARSSLKTWFFGVVRRLAASRGRRRALHRRLLERFAGSAPAPDPAADPQHLAEAASDQQRVAQALAALPQRQQQLVELVFWHDLSIRESAGVLGVRLGTARTHYARAKRRLALALSSRDGI
ncbi:MAG: RNA polymerase sigma factor [Deltaproteobacteria bacterium]|nr:RNA polymerase sigma factor [Deltaproteobacteria bacterium]